MLEKQQAEGIKDKKQDLDIAKNCTLREGKCPNKEDSPKQDLFPMPDFGGKRVPIQSCPIN